MSNPALNFGGRSPHRMHTFILHPANPHELPSPLLWHVVSVLAFPLCLHSANHELRSQPSKYLFVGSKVANKELLAFPVLLQDLQNLHPTIPHELSSQPNPFAAILPWYAHLPFLSFSRICTKQTLVSYPALSFGSHISQDMYACPACGCP